MSRFALAALVLVACQRTAREPPPTSNTPAVRPLPHDAAIDAPPDAAPHPPVDAPPGNVLHGVAMHGPSASLHASCMTASPCGGSKEKGMVDFADPPKSPDCSRLDDDPNSAHPETLSAGQVRVASVQCAIPPELKMHWTGQSYHLFAHRADGWWRSDELYSTFTNDKYDGEDLSASWEHRGTRYILRLHREIGSVGCNKQSEITDDADALYVIDLDGAAPEVYGPIVVSGRRKVELYDAATDVGEDGDDDECKPTQTAARLRVRWIDASTLELSGRPSKAFGLATPGTYQLVP